MDSGETVGDVPVLLFAVQGRVWDPQTEKTVSGPVILIGYRDPETDQLLRAGTYFAPLDPADGEYMHWAMGGGRTEWIMIGAVNDPTVTEVTATAPDGKRVDVGLSDQEVAPGLRVFWSSGGATHGYVRGVEVRLLDANGNTVESCVLGDIHCAIPG